MEMTASPLTAPQPNQMRGRWLFVGRAFWLLLFGLCVWTLVSSLPQSYELLSNVCAADLCESYQLTHDKVENLARWGLPVSFYTWYTLILIVLFAAVYWAIALLIFWRRSDDRMALYTSITLLLFSTFLPELTAHTEGDRSLWSWVMVLATLAAWVAFANLLYIFPDGRYLPRWTLLLAIGWLLLILSPITVVLFELREVLPYVDLSEWPPLLQILVILLLFGGGLYGQIYRYRDASTPLQRQQTKWVVYGLVVATVTIIGLNDFAYAVAPELTENSPIYYLISNTLGLAAVIFMGGTFAVAIIRYRLWDIDLVIRRTLVYGLLSTVLALIYYSSVLFFEQVRPAFDLTSTKLETVLSTLLITALFAPLRRLIQAQIDRRFYRRKYDAEQVLAALNTQLQREVEIERVRSALLSAADETWQPTHTSLWFSGGMNGPAAEEAPAIASSDPLLAHARQSAGVVDLPTLTLDSPAARNLRAAGVTLIAPLVSQGELIGLLNLGARRSEQEYTGDDRRLLHTLAGQAAPALRVAQLVEQQKIEALQRERIEQEMRVARIIQETLLPHTLPAIDGWRIDAYWQPAQAVGGDFYDFIGLPNNRLGIVIGDVTDKGVPAALVMASTRSTLRSAAERHESPGAVLAHVNNLLHPEIPAKMFVTCLYAIFEPATGRFWFANAGHNLPALRTAHGVTPLRATGMPLGLMPDMEYEEAETALAPGDAILLYSDGLVEAHNPQREMFGFQRVHNSVASHQPAVLLGGLRADLTGFAGAEWEQEDDVTMVVVERLPNPNAGNEAGEPPAQPPPSESAPGETHLLHLQTPSLPGNERPATSQVMAAIKAAMSLPQPLLERVATAVAETLMNAIEHGNQFQPDKVALVDVWASPQRLRIRVVDQGGGPPIPTTPEPDLEAKLAGLQSPRGWGLFLIKNMVDEMQIQTDDAHHIVDLIFVLSAV